MQELPLKELSTRAGVDETLRRLTQERFDNYSSTTRKMYKDLHTPYFVSVKIKIVKLTYFKTTKDK